MTSFNEKRKIRNDFMNNRNKIMENIENLYNKALNVFCHKRKDEYTPKPQALEVLTMLSVHATDSAIEGKSYKCNHPSFYNALCAFNIAAENLHNIFMEIHNPFIKLTVNQARKVASHYLENKPGNPIIEINGKKIEVSKETLFFNEDELDKLKDLKER